MLKSSTRGESSERTDSRFHTGSRFHNGYIRKTSKNRDDIHLRGDMAKHTGITTVVAAGGQAAADLDEHYANGLSRTGSGTALKDARGWNHGGEGKSTDGDSDDYIPSQSDYDQGIRKTVQVSQV